MNRLLITAIGVVVGLWLFFAEGATTAMAQSGRATGTAADASPAPIPIATPVDKRTGSASAESAPAKANEADTDVAKSSSHYSTRSGVVLSKELQAKANEVADRFFNATGKKLLITSGTRTAAGQAAAMFTKLQLGDDLSIYTNRAAAQEIKEAYQAAKKAGRSEAEIKVAMTKVIQQQIERGTVISKHLLGNAFDVRIEGLSAADRQALENAVKASGGKTLLESTPPHLHVQFDNLKGQRMP